MSKPLKWVCGFCTYENFPASLKCVICCQPCSSPLIKEPEPDLDVITESSRNADIIIPNRSPEIRQQSTVIKYRQREVPDSIYHESLSTEFEKKALICNETPESEQLAIHGAGAASGASSSDANKNNEINKKWSCQSCTYVNWPKSTKCVICQNPKSNPAQTQIGVRSPGSSNSEDDAPASIFNPPSVVKSQQSRKKSKGSQPCSPQPGACGRLCRSYSSNMPLRSNDAYSPTPPTARAISRQKKSYSEENLNNSVNSNDFISSYETSTKGRHFSSDTPNSGHQKESGTENLSKLRDVEHTRAWKKSNKRLNILFLKACVGILEDNIEAVDRYLAYGGSVARPLSADEASLLNRPSAFNAGYTLVHLAVRFQRQNILGLILTPERNKRNLKRCPAILCPEIAEHIRHEIINSIRIMKGEFHCQYFCDYLTFFLPIEIASLPSSIQRLLFDELLDKDVQKELEDEIAINWCSDTDRLYALWNRSAGDCLLDSVLQATWGVFDRDNVLRRAMASTMQECSPYFYTRWKEWEVMQARMMNFSITERQYLHDWAYLLSLAGKPGASLEHCHIFVLSHILRRPIIVYGVKYLKSYHGDTLGYAKFQGVYLPFLWERSFCWKSPIALGYTRGHFTALVTMENDSRDAFNGMSLESSSDVTSSSCTYLPLMDCDRKLLPIHFTSPNQGQLDAEQECILYDWLDCLVTNNGVLVAKQKQGKRPPLVARMLDQWLDHYRHLSFRRLGEDGETEDEE